ncbi:MAG TPA: LysR family transcriptional regulator [Solirubrobacterales bacterium]|nr:LysR family transcriptional regulator [Solirubrobacterales bacterium]
MAESYDNRISLHKLEVFCLVVELGGVSRAAEHLIVAQPVVSAHIHTLQERLGVKLLYREGHAMKLTDEGQRVYRWASETLSRTRELVRELDGIAEGQRGSVAIAASMTVGSYLLPPLLSRLRRERPGARITLSISDPEGAVEAVERGDSDFAVLVGKAPANQGKIAAEEIGSVEIVLVAAPDFMPELSEISVADLGGLPLISSPAGHIRRSLIDDQLAARGVSPRDIVIELGHPEAMKRATLEGLGLCLLFRASVGAELERGELRTIAIDDAAMTVPLLTMVREGKRLSPVQSEVLEAVREGAAERWDREHEAV